MYDMIGRREKVPVPPVFPGVFFVWAQYGRSGKCTAKSKGVHCEMKSEESWRQSSGLANRNHIRLRLGIRLHNKSNEMV